MRHSHTAEVKKIEVCVTCGGPHAYYNCTTTDGTPFDANAITGTSNQGVPNTVLKLNQITVLALNMDHLDFLHPTIQIGLILINKEGKTLRINIVPRTINWFLFNTYPIEGIQIKGIQLLLIKWLLIKNLPQMRLRITSKLMRPNLRQCKLKSLN